MQLIDVDIHSFTYKTQSGPHWRRTHRITYHESSGVSPRDLRGEVGQVNYLGLSNITLRDWGPPAHASWVCLPDVRRSSYRDCQRGSFPYRYVLLFQDRRVREGKNQVWNDKVGSPTVDEVWGFISKEDET